MFRRGNGTRDTPESVVSRHIGVRVRHVVHSNGPSGGSVGSVVSRGVPSPLPVPAGAPVSVVEMESADVGECLATPAPASPTTSGAGADPIDPRRGCVSDCVRQAK